jgi:hypothetical protein
VNTYLDLRAHTHAHTHTHTTPEAMVNSLTERQVLSAGHLPGMCQTLGAIPSNEEKKRGAPQTHSWVHFPRMEPWMV